ncbi:MAG: exopolyphosphatase [Chitinophagaceae bacterium]|nr:exopolyphosphatase [Chitinophagaceae bacterium]MCW5904423.1 exopolyphosphatase [Chitinophagaceae bacterium]
MKLAAIDIGSNAARLLISEVTHTNGTPQFCKLNLIRVPLRLGFDVFEYGEISKQKKNMIIDTMKAFSYLIKAYNIQYIKACATSAMRDAANSSDIIKKVKTETGIDIEIISGDAEAAFIYENHIAENLDKEHSYLYIDVGGGSTELTFFADGKLKYKESFNIGTIRLLKGLVTEENWNELKEHLKLNTKSNLPITAIGSGGNINKIFSLSKRKDGKPLSLELLKDYYKEFSSVSLAERIRIYKLKEDRADVIVPALQIYISIMRWADIEEIYVPKIGLTGGLVQNLYEEVSEEK